MWNGVTRRELPVLLRMEGGPDCKIQIWIQVQSGIIWECFGSGVLAWTCLQYEVKFPARSEQRPRMEGEPVKHCVIFHLLWNKNISRACFGINLKKFLLMRTICSLRMLAASLTMSIDCYSGCVPLHVVPFIPLRSLGILTIQVGFPSGWSYHSKHKQLIMPI